MTNAELEISRMNVGPLGGDDGARKSLLANSIEKGDGALLGERLEAAPDERKGAQFTQAQPRISNEPLDRDSGGAKVEDKTVLPPAMAKFEDAPAIESTKINRFAPKGNAGEQ